MSGNNLAVQIKEAIGAHGAWKLKLKTAINVGYSEYAPKDVRCNDKCRFGQWLHSPDISDEIRTSTPYRVIDRLHSEFHECAANVLELATSGQPVDALKMLDGEFTLKSEKLVRGLQKWKGEVA